MKKITLIDKIDKNKGHILPNKKEITLGRSSENDIQIPIASVSKKHCALYRGQDGRLSVQDFGSKNGTYVNDKRIKKYPLKNNDELKLCKYLLKVKISNEESSSDLTSIERKVGEKIKQEKPGDSDTDYDFAKEIDNL